MRCPTSSQCGIPLMLPLYPVESIVLSLAMTAPTCFLSQVLLVATSFAMFMKYCSQLTLVISAPLIICTSFYATLPTCRHSRRLFLPIQTLHQAADWCRFLNFPFAPAF